MFENKFCFSKRKIKTLLLGGVLIITAFLLTKYINDNLHSSSAIFNGKNKSIIKTKPDSEEQIIATCKIKTVDTGKTLKSLYRFLNKPKLNPIPLDDKGKLVEMIALRDLKYPGSYNYLLLDTAIFPSQLEILRPLVYPIYLREKIIALAVPKSVMMGATSVFTAISLALNPGIVQDVSEGTPQVCHNGQVYELDIQQVTYLRVEGVINAFSIATTDGNEIARITEGDPSAIGDSQSEQCRVEGNCPTPQITPPPNQQPQGAPADQQQIKNTVEGREFQDSNLGRLLNQWRLERNGDRPFSTIRVRVDDNSPEIELPYYDMRSLNPALNARDIRDLIRAAEADGIIVRLHLAPGRTVDPVLDVYTSTSNPGAKNVLTIAIDNEMQLNTKLIMPTYDSSRNSSEPVVINLEQYFISAIGRSAPESARNIFSGSNQSFNVALYTKLDLRDLLAEPGISFSQVKVVAPYPSTELFSQEIGYQGAYGMEFQDPIAVYVRDASNLLRPGGRFDVVLHQGFGGDYVSTFTGYMNDFGTSYGFTAQRTLLSYSEFVSTYGPSTSTFLNSASNFVNVINLFRP